MARNRSSSSASPAQMDSASKGVSSHALPITEGKTVAIKNESSHYGLRKRTREVNESENSERPSKTRPASRTQGDLVGGAAPTTTPSRTKTKAKVPQETKVPPRMYSCRICSEDLAISRFPRRPMCPASCVDCLTGYNRICKKCITLTITAQLESRDLDKLGCPSCNEHWDYRYLVAFLPHEKVVRLDARIVNRGMILEEGWRWCAHKTCSFGQIYELSLIPGINPEYCAMYFCQGCHRSNCFKHQTPWHDNLTCAQYDYRQEHERQKAGGMTDGELAEQERDTLQLMQTQQTRVCPYCGHAVQKAYGCDNMLCFVCGEAFLLTNAKKVSAKPVVKHEYNMRKRKEIKYTK
ncbi:MAG: hypothetical protein M1821_005399 [Bathelium mastoideum]|nr:MAG: hypothetical protein M1821_005399 [Bathelium mastoideum]